jgi:hypothetical protein
MRWPAVLRAIPVYMLGLKYELRLWQPFQMQWKAHRWWDRQSGKEHEYNDAAHGSHSRPGAMDWR